MNVKRFLAGLMALVMVFCLLPAGFARADGEEGDEANGGDGGGDRTVNHFTVSVVFDQEQGAATGGGEYIQGATATLTATPADGYTFVYWAENGQYVSDDNPYSFTVEDDRELEALFEPIEGGGDGGDNGGEGDGEEGEPCTLQAGVSPAGSGYFYVDNDPEDAHTSFDRECYEGDEVTLTAVANEGYQFVNWTEGAEPLEPADPTITVDMNGDRSVTANFEPVVAQASLTLLANNGVTDPEAYTEETITVNAGSQVTLPGNPFTYGTCVFMEWNTAADGSGTAYAPDDVITLNADLTLYARWGNPVTVTILGDSSKISYTVWRIKGGITASPIPEDAIQITDASPFVVPLGWAVSLWITSNGARSFLSDASFTSPTGEASGTETSPDDIYNHDEVTFCGEPGAGPIHISVVVDPMALTLKGNGGTRVTGSQWDDPTTLDNQVPGNWPLTPDNPFTYEGHTFTGWNTLADGNGTAYAANAQITLNADLTLYAQWEEDVPSGWVTVDPDDFDPDFWTWLLEQEGGQDNDPYPIYAKVENGTAYINVDAEDIVIVQDGFTSLRGVNRFVNLKILQYDGYEDEHLTELDLSGVTGLEELWLNNNALKPNTLTIDPAAKAKIWKLELANNRLDENDYGQHEVTDILSGLTALRELNLSGNFLMRLDVSGLPSLKYLDVQNNPELAYLKLNSGLKTLCMGATKLSLGDVDFNGAALTGLKIDYMFGDQHIAYSDLVNCASLNGLETLDLDNHDWGGQFDFTPWQATLRDLRIDGCGLTVLTLGNTLPNLTRVRANDNDLTSLDLSHVTPGVFDELYIGGNAIPALTLPAGTRLQYLGWDENALQQHIYGAVLQLDEDTNIWSFDLTTLSDELDPVRATVPLEGAVAEYDSATGVVTFGCKPESFTYTYDIGDEGQYHQKMPVTVSFQPKNAPYQIRLDGGALENFEYDEATGLWTYDLSLAGDAIEGVNGFVHYLVDIYVDGEQNYAVRSTAPCVARDCFIFDTASGIRLTDQVEFWEDMSVLHLLLSHTGTHTILLDPEDLTLTVTCGCEGYGDHYSFLVFAEFEEAQANVYVLGDVLSAIQYYEPNDFWSPPTAAEVPTAEFGEEQILWSTFSYLENIQDRYFLIGEYGRTYGGTVTEFQLQQLAESPSLRVNRNSVPADTGVTYDFYYGAGSHNLMVKRRAVTLTMSAVDANNDPMPRNVILTVSPEGTIYEGDTITVTAPYAAGYRFIGWYFPGEDDPITNAFSFALCITEDTELEARYVQWAGVYINETTFPSGSFRAYLDAYVDLDHDGFLSGEEIGAVTAIHLEYVDEVYEGVPYSWMVNDLTGIEYFPLLEELWCGYNGFGMDGFGMDGFVTFVDLSHNLALKVVDLNGQPLEAVDVSMLPDLEELNLGFTNVAALDLTENPALQRLTVNATPLTSLDLRYNPGLVWLDVCDTGITELDLTWTPHLLADFRAGCRTEELIGQYPYLAGRMVYGGTGDEYYHLAMDPALVPNVIVPYNVAASFPDPAFRAYVAAEIDLDGNGELTEDERNWVGTIQLDGAYQNPDDPDGEYTYADCVTSLEGIELFPNLHELNCDPFTFGVDGHLTQVDLSGNTEIQYLDLGCQPIETLDVSMLEDLEELNVGFTHLETINLSQNENLRKLIISDSRLQALDLSHNNSLIVLDVCGNPDLTVVDLRGCPALEADYLAGELHFPQLPYLTEDIHVYGDNSDGEGQLYRLAVNTHMQVKAGAPIEAAIAASALCGEAALTGVTIFPAGDLYEGNYVTLTAPVVPGYTYNGWFEGDAQLTPNLVFSFQVSNGDDRTFVARYTARTEKASVRVTTANGALFTVDDDATQQDSLNHAYTLGTVLTLKAVEPDRVLQWENGSRKVIGRGGELQITVTGEMDIHLVYEAAASATQSFVQFVSDYGQVLLSQKYSAFPASDVPDAPTKFGYDFAGWAFEGEAEAQADIVAAVNDRIGQEATITVKPRYTKQEIAYTVTVEYEGVAHDDDVYADVQMGSNLTVAADEYIDGCLFQYWKIGETIVGYQPEYFLKVAGDVTLTAVYGAASVEVLPVITMSELSQVVSGSTHKVSGSATRDIPDGYTLVEHGVLFARGYQLPDGSTLEESFVLNGAGVSKYVSNATMNRGVVKVNVKVDNDDVVVTLRGYMVLRYDKTGNEEIYYSGIVSGAFKDLAPNA